MRGVEIQIAIDFISGDVMEPKIMPPRRLKQHIRTIDIGTQEWSRIQDGIIIMRFGGEVDDRINRRRTKLRRDQGFNQFRITDVPMDKCHAFLRYTGKIRTVTSISECVQYGYAHAGMLTHHIMYEIRADESRTAGYQQMPGMEYISFISHDTHGM